MIEFFYFLNGFMHFYLVELNMGQKKMKGDNYGSDG